MDAIGNYAQGTSAAVQQATQRRQLVSKNNADRQQPAQQTQDTGQTQASQTTAPQRQVGRAEQLAGQLTQQLATEHAHQATQTVGNAQPQEQDNGNLATVTKQRKQQAVAQYQAQAQEHPQTQPQRQQQAQTQQTHQAGGLSIRA